MSRTVELLDRIQELERENKQLKSLNEKLQHDNNILKQHTNFLDISYDEKNEGITFKPHSFWELPLNNWQLANRNEQIDFGGFIAAEPEPWMVAEEIGFGKQAPMVSVDDEDIEETKQKVREMTELIATLNDRLENINAPLSHVVDAIKRKARYVNPGAAYQLFETMDYIFKDFKPWADNAKELMLFFEREKRGLSQNSHVTDQQMADAICMICGKDKILNEKQSWMGVCCLVKSHYDYPHELDSCCKRLAELPYREKPYIECCYDNVRKLAVYGFYREPYDKWENYRPNDTEKKYYNKCYDVARALEAALMTITSQ